MIDPIEYHYINWVDGMKISRTHFAGLQQAVEGRLKDVRALVIGTDGFGLLGNGLNDEDSLEYKLIPEGAGKFTVEVKRSRGITPAGDRVEIVSETYPGDRKFSKRFELDEQILKSESEFYLTIAVSSKEFSAVGTPDPDESPARFPHTESKYALELLPVAQFRDKGTAGNYLVIGKVDIQNGEAIVDGSYIPPCATLHSYPDLAEFVIKYLQFLRDIESNLFKILNNLSRKESHTQLATNVGNMVRNIVSSLEMDLDSVVMYARHARPSFLIWKAKRLARAFKSGIELNSNAGKEELLNYIQEVIDIGPGEYTSINSRLLDLEYDHYNLHDALYSVLQFCKINGKLIDEWSRLDYIGKKKKAGIFIGEVNAEPEPSKAPSKKKWDF